MKKKYDVNIRTLVEFILRSGDLVSGTSFNLNERALLGAKIHRKLQKEFEKLPGFRAEVSVKYQVESDNVILNISGRADGARVDDGILQIDEIKTIETDLENIPEAYPVHTAQAKCYAYIIASQENIKETRINIIYYNIENDTRKTISELYNIGQLEEFFLDVVNKYMKWKNYDANRRNNLEIQIEKMKFPFGEYRPGQYKLAGAVYKTIAENEHLFVQAPTGIGKTVSVIFPALKALREGFAEKIFFLTARNVGALAPSDTIILLSQQSSDLSFVSLTSKEKICPFNCDCNPSSCPRAKGYFDRINNAVFDAIVNQKHFTRDVILNLAEFHNVCPFEMSLDISLWVDIIIGDYNYLFDPNAMLQRFFATGGGNYCFLVDEAHNLQDRARDMYSAHLNKHDFLEISRMYKNVDNSVFSNTTLINKYFIELRKSVESDCTLFYSLDDKLIRLLESFCHACEKFLEKDSTFGDDPEKKLLDLYFESLFYLKICEYFDEKFCSYVQISNNEVITSLYCADPSKIINDLLKKGTSAILFSGTLQPIQYFKAALGGDEQDKMLIVPSPFPEENRLVIISSDVATTYKRRENYYEVISKYIIDLTKIKKGNYMVYFSSHKFISEVSRFLPFELMEDLIFVQPKTTDPEIREKFLEDFTYNPVKTRIGLCVLGGIYSEGIDLVGDRLSGVIIVGVGLPQVCPEREIIRDVFNRDEENSGFQKAYVYPGMNKVLQASGRVIRTFEDRGFIVLLDERYLNREYYNLLSSQWNVRRCRNREEVIKLINDFL